MQFHLVVVRAFGTYGKGDVISDGAAMAAILGDERARNVVKVAVTITQGG